MDKGHGRELDRPGGSFYGWRRSWALPPIAAPLGGEIAIDASPSAELVAHLAGLSESEVIRRLNNRHDLFLLRAGGEPAAYGWSAAGPAEIGGLAFCFTVPPGQRYLWDFVTLPMYRGRGLYPRLLQEIVRRQVGEAEWFWIGHEPNNKPSESGIRKAGFRLAGQVWRLQGGQLAFAPAAGAEPELARGAADALGLKLLNEHQ